MSGPKPDSAPIRKKLPHTTPWWVRDGAIFFITVCCTPRGLNQLCNRSTADSLFESVQFRQCRGDWYVHLLLLMPDHLHGLISFPRDRAMRKVISSWKEIVAKKTGVSWQRDFFDHRVRHGKSYSSKADYIRMNPVRKNLVAHSELWSFVWRPDLSDQKAGPAVPPYPLTVGCACRR